MNDDLDRMLRDILESEARSYEPSGDGLTRIRTRVAARRARLRWMVPSLALVAAAAGVAGVLVLPSFLPGQNDTVRPPVAQSGSPDPSGPPSVGPSSSPSPGSTPSPLPNAVTIWPYASRTEAAANAPADVSSGRLPFLNDAKSTALHFATDFIGVKTAADNPLIVTRTQPLEAGIGVTLGRKNPNLQTFEVTTVYLIRVARGNDAPYVVVRASAPGLQVTDVSPGQAGVVSVSGYVAGVHQSVQARLLATDGRVAAQGIDGAAGAERPWRVVLGSTGKPVPAGRYAVAAQTSSDADGYISELYVRPYNQP